MESRHGTELVQGAIYEFHKPDPGQRIQVEIVFMHGLQVKAADLKNAYYKTWRTADGNEVWPETWLKEKYPNARILSLAYDSSARKFEIVGNMGPYLLGESLLHQMVSANVGQNDCPVVFVGHSLGGLIAKEIVVRCNSDRANAKYQNLLHNLKAVFFYATPHGGSYLADSWITKIARGLRVETSSLVKYLEPEGTDRTHIHDNFLRAVNKDCKFYVVAEGRKTEFVKVCFIRSSAWIVRENSARFPSHHHFVMLPYADHKTVCKPQSKNDTGYLKLIDCIDAVIQEYKRRITVDLSVDPIGIEGKIDDISKQLERPGVSIVGLFGMGGVGKTTLSKAFYNLEAFKYVKSCYLENVKSKGVEDVQKELLRGLCGRQLNQHEHVEKQHVDMIKDCFLTQKVLVVIDDVSSEDCLRDLQVFHALEIDGQSNKSKVVVTSRNQAILLNKYLNSGKAFKLDVNGITEDFGLKLFLQYAFDAVRADVKVEVKIELLGEAQKIVKLCNGLPLSLEVLGKYLGNSIDEDYQQRKEIWAEAYERLKKAQTLDGDKSDKLWSNLRISYDHLGDLEKKMFLDFACIFSEMGVDKRLVEQIWGSPIGVQNLINKSLLKVQDGHFVMHDQLRDMGRHMLLKEALKDSQHPIYLWSDSRFFPKTYMEFKELTTESGVPYIASLQQQVGKSLCQYSKLRLLNVDGCYTPSLVDDCLSQCSGDLRWLDLCHSRVTKIGMQKLCSFGGLRVLQISYCDDIVELPQDIGKLMNLVEIEVHHCRNLRSLPDSIGELKNLKRLVIAFCLKLQVVPSTIRELSELEYLSFENCCGLMAIDGTQICTQKLIQLELPFIPTTCLGPCPQLRHLYIANGQGVEEFPQDFFKIDMPKLKVVEWRHDNFVEVVLKNPNGSQLLLEKGSYGITNLEVKRHSDGSITQLNVGHTRLESTLNAKLQYIAEMKNRLTKG